MKIISNRNKFFLISGFIILIGIAAMIFNFAKGNGLFNYDVEFSGGLSIQIDIGQDFDNDDIAKIVTDITNQPAPQIQKVLGTNQVIIKIKSVDREIRTTLINEILNKYNITDDSVTISDVSATISSEMQKNAIISVVLACIAMLIYVSIRFHNIKTGTSAILALIHDSLITILVYAIFRIPLNYSFIAVILTILGYSINSTIIVFDRVRENKKLNHKLSDEEILDKSVTQTMRRSIFTSITTLLSIICLYIIGVPSIKEFALPIIIGIICGTYASTCLAPSFWYLMNKK